MRSRSAYGITRFAGDERGTFGVLFAMMLVPMLGITLTAIDYGRSLLLENKLQAAADSTTAAAVHKIGQERDTVLAAARQHLTTVLPEDMKDTPAEIAVSEKSRSIEVRLERKIPTTIIALAGLKSFTVRVASVAYAGQPPARSIAAEISRDAPPEVARAMDQIARQPGADKLLGKLTPEQQAQMNEVNRQLERLMGDALSRIGR